MFLILCGNPILRKYSQFNTLIFFCYLDLRSRVISSGFVYLYHLPDDSSWSKLDLSHPSRIVSTEQEHVNAVAIGDDGAGPCIVIATEGSFITVIQWRRKTVLSQ